MGQNYEYKYIFVAVYITYTILHYTLYYIEYTIQLKPLLLHTSLVGSFAAYLYYLVHTCRYSLDYSQATLGAFGYHIS